MSPFPSEQEAVDRALTYAGDYDFSTYRTFTKET